MFGRTSKKNAAGASKQVDKQENKQARSGEANMRQLENKPLCLVT